MAARKSKTYSSPPFSSPSSPSSFFPAISTVAVAQICRSVGYTATEPAAIRSLSDIAAVYLQTLARSAADIANRKGRIQSNILDLTHAVEDLTASIGFAGASDPTKPLLKSSVLKELSSFVKRVKEVPFAKPIKKELKATVSSPVSFAVAGREPPGAHVPRWLPCFPENWGKSEERKEKDVDRRKWEDKEAIFGDEKPKIEEKGKKKEVNVEGIKGRNNKVWKIRERVRFKLRGENINEKKKSMERKKRSMLMLVDDDEEIKI